MKYQNQRPVDTKSQHFIEAPISVVGRANKVQQLSQVAPKDWDNLNLVTKHYASDDLIKQPCLPIAVVWWIELKMLE